MKRISRVLFVGILICLITLTGCKKQQTTLEYFDGDRYRTTAMIAMNHYYKPTNGEKGVMTWSMLEAFGYEVLAEEVGLAYITFKATIDGTPSTVKVYFATSDGSGTQAADETATYNGIYIDGVEASRDDYTRIMNEAARNFWNEKSKELVVQLSENAISNSPTSSTTNAVSPVNTAPKLTEPDDWYFKNVTAVDNEKMHTAYLEAIKNNAYSFFPSEDEGIVKTERISDIGIALSAFDASLECETGMDWMYVKLLEKADENTLTAIENLGESYIKNLLTLSLHVHLTQQNLVETKENIISMVIEELAYCPQGRDYLLTQEYTPVTFARLSSIVFGRFITMANGYTAFALEIMLEGENLIFLDERFAIMDLILTNATESAFGGYVLTFSGSLKNHSGKEFQAVSLNFCLLDSADTMISEMDAGFVSVHHPGYSDWIADGEILDFTVELIASSQAANVVASIGLTGLTAFGY